MFGWLRGGAQPTRGQLLAAVPVQNRLVSERRLEAGGDMSATVLRLTAAVAPGRLQGVLRRTSHATKSFDLDELGAFVWDATDGKRTVEGLIQFFARQQRVNLREAEVAVLAFLKTLAERNLIALAVEKQQGAGRRTGQRIKTAK